MSKTLQIRIDDFLKLKADKLFSNLGLDTSTAIRIFLKISTEMGGLPFEVKLPQATLEEAMQDVITNKNLSKPYKSARAAIEAMLEE